MYDRLKDLELEYAQEIQGLKEELIKEKEENIRLLDELSLLKEQLKEAEESYLLLGKHYRKMKYANE